jgi:hypothetical protein
MIVKFRFLVNKKIPLMTAMEALTEDVLIQGVLLYETRSIATYGYKKK